MALLLHLVNIARTLRQTVAWEKVTSADDRTDRTYAAAVNVAARKVAKSKDMIAKDGELTTATAQITVLASPAMGDLMDGREVIRIDAMTDFRGNVVGYHVYTR